MKLDGVEVHHGDCLTVLKMLSDNSVDSVVTDPPYGLSNTDPKHVAEALGRWGAGERDFIPEGKGFMGKAWDAFVPPPAVWDECLRVLKPGGHLLAFAGSRTFDLMALSVRLAGFEIRDSIAWLYGSGFPKSLDVSKAIDKASGYDGKVIGTETVDIGMQGGSMHAGRETKLAEREIKELSPDAKKWQGWGTALKPAFEPVVVARKPLTGTVAGNVLEWGVGGLNIDGTRIGTETLPAQSRGVSKIGTFENADGNITPERSGRWPSNVMLDEFTAGLVDEQSGNEASRFFYVAKASKRDRNEGLEELEERIGENGNKWTDQDYRRGDTEPVTGRKNFHPTVKPTDLMRQLVRLVTPPGGVVLDPFTGSGSTGKAAILEGFRFIGVELTEEYLPIIEGRLRYAMEQRKEIQASEDEVLF